MRDETGFGGALKVFGKRVNTYCDERGAFESAVRVEGTRDLVAVHSGQPDIAEHDVGAEFPCLGYSLGTVVRHLDLMLAERKHVAKTVRCIDVVFDDQDAVAKIASRLFSNSARYRVSLCRSAASACVRSVISK